jgi:hypothetical protein
MMVCAVKRISTTSVNGTLFSSQTQRLVIQVLPTTPEKDHIQINILDSAALREDEIAQNIDYLLDFAHIML